MATQTRPPTSEVEVTGTWSGTSRHLLLDDHPDSGNPIADGTTCSAAGALVLGFSAFTVPAGSTGISVQVLYYDFKNASQSAANGALIRCNDTTNRLAGSHNPGNGNANIALRTIDYGATNPKSGAAWTVDDVNGVGTNGLTAFGVDVTDASPSSTISSIQLQVTYTEPVTGTGALAAQASDVSGSGVAEWVGSGSLAAQSAALSGAGEVSDGGITGSGALNCQSATLSGSGLSESIGAGDLADDPAAIEGDGISEWLATGALLAGFSTMDGSGEVSGAGESSRPQSRIFSADGEDVWFRNQ